MSWNERYESQDTPWDQDGPSALVQRLAAEVLSPGARVLVPGCGRGHDVVALAAAGFRVTGLDLAPAAIEQARQRYGEPAHVEWVVGDLLALPAERPGAFDAVVEHTCYCALDPTLLDAYAEAVEALLTPQGVLLGAFLAHDDGGQGPPYGTSIAALKARFGHMQIERLVEAGSYGLRSLPQLAGVFRKRA